MIIAEFDGLRTQRLLRGWIGVAGENPSPFVYLFKDGLIEEKC